MLLKCIFTAVASRGGLSLVVLQDTEIYGCFAELVGRVYKCTQKGTT